MKKLPHRNELMAPTVEAIKLLGGSASIDEIVERSCPSRHPGTALIPSPSSEQT
jgi:hypothetical protein